MHPHLKAALGAAIALTLGMPAAASADTTTSSGTVTGDTLSFAAPGSADWATGITLNGSDHVASVSIPLDVNDARGTGAGWNLSIKGTQFTNDDGKVLPSDASSLSGVTSACASGTCTSPDNSASTYPGSVPVGAAPAGTFFRAATDSGMGKFTVTPAIDVSVPANSYAGTYSSTLTLAATSGP
jgi:hypothetical protein